MLLSLCCGIPYGFSSQSLRSCGHTNDVAGMKAGCIIAFVFVLAAWLIFFDARYLNANGFIKSAIIVLIASVWTALPMTYASF